MQLTRIPQSEPKNQQALAAKAANDKTLKELAGQIADDSVLKEASKGRRKN